MTDQKASGGGNGITSDARFLVAKSNSLYGFVYPWVHGSIAHFSTRSYTRQHQSHMGRQVKSLFSVSSLCVTDRRMDGQMDLQSDRQTDQTTNGPIE